MRNLSVIAVILAFVLITGCASEQESNKEALTVDDFKVNQTSAEVTEDDFVYRLVTEKGEYSEAESVHVYAELEYIGDKSEITIFHSESPFYFPMSEKTRDMMIHYPMNEPLKSTTLIKGEQLRETYNRSGGYGSQDKKEYVDFMKDFLGHGFPTGYYIVSGSADFYVESDTDGKLDKRDYRITAQIDFKVR